MAKSVPERKYRVVEASDGNYEVEVGTFHRVMIGRRAAAHYSWKYYSYWENTPEGLERAKAEATRLTEEEAGRKEKEHLKSKYVKRVIFEPKDKEKI